MARSRWWERAAAESAAKRPPAGSRAFAKLGRKVVVGYPVGGSVTLAFHASMLQLLAHEMPKPDSERLLAKVTHTQGLYVADNRNLLIQRLLETESDWLLQIDTDIEFPPTLIETLLDIAGSGKKVLAASVPLGSYPTCAFLLTDKAGIWEGIPQIVGEVMECDGVATAVLLTHRSVYEDIADRHGQCWMHHIYLPSQANKPETSPRGFKFLSQGEDLAFSIRAKEAGHRLWCAYVPGLKHHKGRTLSHDEERTAAMAEGDHGVGELVQEGVV